MTAADGVVVTGEKRPTGTGRPTSRDVPRLAGASHTAVSFVFNGLVLTVGLIYAAMSLCRARVPEGPPDPLRRPAPAYRNSPSPQGWRRSVR
jgi:hypothetical protein